ncbi:MAG: DUF418 domain-containing protein [Acidobacteria bacterium]|nr:DUF418 domain-containing protein [Acidobacteriota bacterium]
MTPENTLSAVAPVAAQERIQSMDVLRGAAVLGILLMNILSFALPGRAYADPSIAGGDTGLNWAYWFANQVFFEGKMRAIFSMLFGAGTALFIARAAERGAGLRIADIYYRRTMWLIVFGLLHGYFVWGGDILYAYGVAGLLLFPLRQANPKWLLALGVFLVLAGSAKYYWDDYENLKLRNKAMAVRALEAQGKPLTEEQKEDKKKWDDKWNDLKPSGAALDKELKAKTGSYWQHLQYRWPRITDGHGNGFYQYDFYDCGGMMLIGMALFLMGVLTGARDTGFYARLALFGYLVGGSVNAYAGWYWSRSGFDPVEGRMVGDLAYDFGRLSMALAHLSVLVLLVKHGWLVAATRRLAACGRMALTCYLFSNLAGTTIFYGHGFGLFNKLQRYQLLYVVFAIWALLLLVSPIWLRHFRYGPMEWVWRSLTYWKKQPMRLLAKEAAPQLEPSTVA